MSSDAFDGEVLSEKLSKLNNSQQSIESLSRWCVAHRKKAKLIVETWDKLFNSSQKEQCISFLYLANDILQNSRRKGSEFVNEFWKVLPSAIKHVCEKGDDSGKKVTARLVEIWEERKVFGSRGQGLKDIMMGKELPPPVLSNGKNQGLIKIMKKDAQAVRVKLTVGSMPEKIVMAFHAANDEKNDEEATLKKFIDILDNASSQGSEPPVEDIQVCIKELESAEETRSALVSQLKEALQDQEAKLDLIRNQLQIARRQIEVPSKMKGVRELSPSQGVPKLESNHIQDAMKMAEANFTPARTSSQPVTSFMPVQSTEEEKKKAAAAAMAAKLTASTSSALMLTSVLSSLVAEEAASMNGGTSSHPPGFAMSMPMYPPEKRAKLDNSTPSSDITNSDTGNNSYFASLQQSMANMPLSQPNQGQSQFYQPPGQPANNHFVQSPSMMVPYGFNTSTSASLPPPPPPPLPPNAAMGFPRPPTTQHQQQQQPSASGGYYRPPGIGFYNQGHQPATPPVPRQ